MKQNRFQELEARHGLNMSEGWKIQKKHVDADLPDDALMYAFRPAGSTGLLMIHEIPARFAMPFDNDQKIIDVAHHSMDLEEGLIAVEHGKTSKQKDYVYTILKRRIPSGKDEWPLVEYTLNMNVKNAEKVLALSGSFMETGNTGIRESQVWEMLEKKHSPEEIRKYWECDPYDLAFRQGFRMNLAENPELDVHFPYHPLSQLRTFIREFSEIN